MYKKISIKIVLILVTAAFLTVPSSVLQVSHAQSNVGLQKTILDIHNEERRIVGVQPTHVGQQSSSRRPELGYLSDYARAQVYPRLVRRPASRSGDRSKGARREPLGGRRGFLSDGPTSPGVGQRKVEL